MMNIKDLSISKELDSKAMTDVRGGSQVINSQTVAQASLEQINYGGVAVALQDTSAHSEIFASNVEDNSTKFFGGYSPWF
ncbi:MAG: hypothetical protein LJE58_14250 [Thiogranum sp.]|jgi:hypothetical protein|nr:hypothetical protein [Thiogranum sp.]